MRRAAEPSPLPPRIRAGRDRPAAPLAGALITHAPSLSSSSRTASRSLIRPSSSWAWEPARSRSSRAIWRDSVVASGKSTYRAGLSGTKNSGASVRRSRTRGSARCRRRRRRRLTWLSLTLNAANASQRARPVRGALCALERRAHHPGVVQASQNAENRWGYLGPIPFQVKEAEIGDILNSFSNNPEDPIADFVEIFLVLFSDRENKLLLYYISSKILKIAPTCCFDS